MTKEFLHAKTQTFGNPHSHVINLPQACSVTTTRAVQVAGAATISGAKKEHEEKSGTLLKELRSPSCSTPENSNINCSPRVQLAATCRPSDKGIKRDGLICATAGGHTVCFPSPPFLVAIYLHLAFNCLLFSLHFLLLCFSDAFFFFF